MANSTMVSPKTTTNLDPAIKFIEKEFNAELSSKQEKFTELVNTLKGANQESTKLDYYKWLDFDYLKKYNSEHTKPFAQQAIDQGYKAALVIGMGGSGVNSLVLKNALYDYNSELNNENSLKLLIQSNLDSTSLLAKINYLKPVLAKTLFVIISKSGNTDEVKRAIHTLINYIGSENFAKQSVIITEPKQEGKNNFLHQLSEELASKGQAQIPVLENDPNIGGRFSMFSPVGMLSAELMGLSSEKLLAGAQSCLEDFMKEGDLAKSNIAKLALADSIFSKDYYARYSMVYSDSLEALNKFRAQLKGESLNKTGIESLVHISGLGTSNHHSDLELLFKEKNQVILEQVFFAKPLKDHQNQATELDCLDSLERESNYQSLLDNHINPLHKYLTENGHPVIQTIIPEQSEEALGFFLMQDMLVTVTQAGLQDKLGSNEKLDMVIRQWEVERYKKSIK